MRKWLARLVVVWLLGEWWSRGGREVLLGPSAEDGSLETFTLWVALPSEARVPVGPAEVPVVSADGRTVGLLTEVREVTRPGLGGYPEEGLEARGEFKRAELGWPINVAIAEAEDFTRRSVASWGW